MSLQYATQTDQLIYAMSKGERYFDPLRHTALPLEAQREPAGGPWLRCLATFYCVRGDYGMLLEYWITLRSDCVADAVNQQIAILENQALPLVNGFDSAHFIGFVRP